MGNFYYVRDHADGTGTATGDGGRYTSQQTGDWDTTFAAATAYYSDVQTALGATTPPAAGDFVCVSSIHSHTDSAASILYDALAEGVTVLVVDDTAIDNQASLTGTGETTTLSGGDISLDGSGIIDGMDITCSDDVTIGSTRLEKPVLRNLALEIGVSAAGIVNCNTANSSFRTENVDLTVSTNGTNAVHLIGQSGVMLEIEGGSTSVAASPTQPFLRVSNDECEAIIKNHAIDPDLTKLVQIDAGANRCKVSVENCSHSAATLLTGTILDRNSWVKIINGNDRDEYYYQGEVHTDTGVYITADGDKEAADYSFKMVSNANAEVGREPLRVLIAKGYIDTSTAKTITTPILHDSATALTDADFYTEVVHLDDTTDLGHIETDKAADIFSPANLATDTNGKWTEAMTNDNEQKSVVTTAQTGKAGRFEVWACLAKTSYTVYVGKPVVT